MAVQTSFPHERPAVAVETTGRGWWRITWSLARLVMVVLIAAATVEQGRLAMAVGAAAGIDASTAVLRLLSFFTVQSNLLAAAVLAWAGVRVLVGRRGQDSAALGVALAAVTTYMLVTGIVYNAVLRGAGDVGIMLGWSNDIHHVIGPAFLLLDLLIAPGRRALRWWSLLVVLVYPVVWAASTLILGPHLVSPSTGTTPWYPYPFLDPTTTPGGYAGVAGWDSGIAAVITGIGALVILVGRLRSRVRGRDRGDTARG